MLGAGPTTKIYLASGATDVRKRFNGLYALFEKARAYARDERMLKTPLPKAVGYRLTRTGELRERFLHAPSRIDNNLAENALRPIKLGAKNGLFVGHENAGLRACSDMREKSSFQTPPPTARWKFRACSPRVFRSIFSAASMDSFIYRK